MISNGNLKLFNKTIENKTNKTNSLKDPFIKIFNILKKQKIQIKLNKNWKEKI